MFGLGRWRGACESMTTEWPTRHYQLFLTVCAMFRLGRWRGACESMMTAWPTRHYQLFLTVCSYVQARKVARCMREHDDCMTYETLSVVSNSVLLCSGSEGGEVHARAWRLHDLWNGGERSSWWWQQLGKWAISSNDVTERIKEIPYFSNSAFRF